MVFSRYHCYRPPHYLPIPYPYYVTQISLLSPASLPTYTLPVLRYTDIIVIARLITYLYPTRTTLHRYHCYRPPHYLPIPYPYYVTQISLLSPASLPTYTLPVLRYTDIIVIARLITYLYPTRTTLHRCHCYRPPHYLPIPYPYYVTQISS